jgi:hypothetical protein
LRSPRSAWCRRSGSGLGAAPTDVNFSFERYRGALTI